MLKILFILLLIFNIQCLVDQERCCCTNCDKDQQGCCCEGKILDPNLYLSETVRNGLCSMIQHEGHFLIVIKQRLKDPKYPQATDDEFTRDTEALFEERCRFFENMCQDGVLISLYIDDKKVRLHAGPNSKEALSVSAREKIINSVKNILLVQNYGEALQITINSIRNYLPSTRSTKERIKDYIGDPIHATKEKIKEYITDPIHNTKEKIKDYIGDPLHSTKERVREYVSDPIYDTKEKVKQKYREYTTTRDEDYEGTGFGTIFFVLFAFIMMGLLCLNFLSKIGNPRRSGYQKLDLHIYAKFLVSLLEDIRKSPERSLLTDHCLLCARTFTRYDPIAYTSGREDEVIRFNCGHLYHRGCIEYINRFKCLCCIENVASFSKNTGENRYYINEMDMTRFIDNLRILYSKQDLDYFYNNYPETRLSFEQNFSINFKDRFGCSDNTQTRGVDYPSFTQDKRGDTAEGGWNKGTAPVEKGNTATGDYNKEKGDTAAGGFDEPRGHGRW